mmetsp:Transcript_32275/g.82244  ORF Transcript_32275/g.82244 Transcript_32275/m.82244 type:complete len:267 (+) Transcript_32275:533-1333(+)
MGPLGWGQRGSSKSCSRCSVASMTTSCADGSMSSPATLCRMGATRPLRERRCWFGDSMISPTSGSCCASMTSWWAGSLGWRSSAMPRARSSAASVATVAFATSTHCRSRRAKVGWKALRLPLSSRALASAFLPARGMLERMNLGSPCSAAAAPSPANSSPLRKATYHTRSEWRMSHSVFLIPLPMFSPSMVLEMMKAAPAAVSSGTFSGAPSGERSAHSTTALTRSNTGAVSSSMRCCTGDSSLRWRRRYSLMWSRRWGNACSHVE